MNVLTIWLATDPWAVPFIFGLIVWSLAWKGIALWKSARAGQKGWFVAMLIINTVGILEIVYIFAVAKTTENIDQRRNM